MTSQFKGKRMAPHLNGKGVEPYLNEKKGKWMKKRLQNKKLQRLERKMMRLKAYLRLINKNSEQNESEVSTVL